jgi:hypothetical protein
MHQSYLIANQFAKNILSVSQIRTNKVNNQHTDVRTSFGQAPPMPAPAAADIQNQSTMGHPGEKIINLAVHHGYGMAIRDRIEIFAMMFGCDSLAQGNFGSLVI